jgi:hypothetical protein
MARGFERASDAIDAVMPGLVPGIHVFDVSTKRDVDGRDKPGHDETGSKTGRS